MDTSEAEAVPAPDPPSNQASPELADVHVPPDLTLLVGKEEAAIPVHRQLLIEHSPYVANLCRKIKSLSRIRVPECEVADMMTLLKFIYLGRLEINEKNLLPSLKAARKFEMKEFFTACSSLINVNNVLLFVNMTDDSVSQTIWNIVDQQADEVLRSDLFLGLSNIRKASLFPRDPKRLTP